MDDSTRRNMANYREFDPSFEGTLMPTAPGSFQRHPAGLVHRLFRIRDVTTLDKSMGNCWLKGRMREGDLVLCVKHSGDCFQDYIVVEEYTNGLRGMPGFRFGGYGCGNAQDTRWSVTATQAEELASGGTVTLEPYDDRPTPPPARGDGG